VLQLVLTRELYEKFPACGEGPLTKARAQARQSPHPRRSRTADRAWRKSGLEPGRGNCTAERERPSALADAFEALLGAIFLDGGFDVGA